MITPPKQPLLDKSGSITDGGTAQDIFAANDSPRYYLHFHNISDTAMWLRFGADAVADKGFYLAPGMVFETQSGVMFGGKLSVLCATTGKKFLCNIA
jgi:hypothetical protein